MATKKPIVVGTDLSALADEAVRQAAAWAARSGAPLVIAHVATERAYSHIDERAVADAIAARARSSAALEPDTRVVIEVGSAPAKLIETADRMNADLLVVGASGASGVSSILFGSTADQVVRHANAAVLVARPSPAVGPVIAATDFSDASTPVVDAAAEQARTRAARLALLHSIYEPPSPLSILGPLVVSFPEHTAEELEGRRYAAKEMLSTFLAQEKLEGDCIVTDRAPANAIVEQAESSGASLVVVGTRGRTGLARVALGSVSARVVVEAPCSVVVVRLGSS